MLIQLISNDNRQTDTDLIYSEQKTSSYATLKPDTLFLTI
ncbi:hypothetical protein [uncultured Gammaproteobacteria bacterium]|nr:hypothetical protein [uncultured Gammaproteobacteria bacterium]